MKLYAEVVSGVVINLVAWDGVAAWTLQNGHTRVDVTALPNVGIGYTYNGTTFTLPVNIIPLNQQYTPQQFGQYILQLLISAAGNLTAAQRALVSNAISPYVGLMMAGDIAGIQLVLSQITPDARITTAVINQLSALITQYLTGG